LSSLGQKTDPMILFGINSSSDYLMSIAEFGRLHYLKYLIIIDYADVSKTNLKNYDS
jgi:hypothetical protein